MLTRLLNFIIYSNVFIATCAVLMLVQTSRFLKGTDSEPMLIGFTFAGTITSYSFHWLLTSHEKHSSDRLRWLGKYKKLLLAFFVISLPFSAYFFYQLLPYWHWLLLSAIVTFLYSAPKISHALFKWLSKVAIGKTIFLAAVWTMVTTLLPLVIPFQGWKDEYSAFLLGRFFFLFALCMIFDYRDRDEDKAIGIRSLITYLDEKKINTIFYLSLLFSAVCFIWLYFLGFELIDVLILLLPNCILLAVFNHAKTHLSDMYYYFFLDGLMMLSALLMLIFRF